jgi:multiple sugar transport system substrate-binding protein
MKIKTTFYRRKNMKKKIKRILPLALAIVMLAAIVACAGPDQPTPTPAPPAQNGGGGGGGGGGDDPPPGGDGDGRVHLVYSLWGGPTEEEDMQVVLDEFNNSQDRIWVTALSIPNEEYAAVIQTMAVGGNMPDVGMANENLIIGWAREGMLMREDLFAGAEDRPLEYLAFKDGGDTVAWSQANEVLALWYNRDMFDAAGIDYPPVTRDTAWTWDEMIEVAKQLTFDANGNTPNDADFDKDNIVQYGVYINQWTWQLEVWSLSNGGRWFSEDGTRIVFDEAAIEAIQKVYDLHLVHHVAPLNSGTTDNGFLDSLGAGNVAMATEGQWATGFTAFNEVDYGVAILPYMQRQANIATGGAVVIWGGTQHPAEAAEFYRWFTDTDNNFGLIEAGWWMPTLRSWYDEPLLTRWIDDVAVRARLPADAYRTAIKDVALDTSITHPTGWYYTPYTYEIINRIMNPALVEAINGTKTVAEVITSIMPAMEAAIAGG